MQAIYQLKSMLSEEVGTVIESSLEIKNTDGNEYIKSEIHSLSVSITKLKILDEKWDGKVYYIKARVQIDENQTLQLLADTVKGKGKQKEIDNLNNLLLKKGIQINSLNKHVKILKNKLDNSIPIVKIITKTKAGYSDLLGTYSYCKGQNYALNLIEDNYPELKNDVFMARTMFNSSFSSSIKIINSIVKKNKKSFQDMNDSLTNIFKKLNFSSKEKAITFINTVKRRAKGEVESPYIENLLMYDPMFDKYPIKELKKGFKQTFHSNGIGKSKGVSFELSMPQSWKSTEAHRPNIVRKFISQNGYGKAVIMVMVKELPIPKDMILSNQDIKDYLITDELIKTVGDTQILKNCGRFELEGQPGYWQNIDTTMQRGKLSTKIKLIQYLFYYQNKLISIQYFVGNINNEMTQEKHLALVDKYKPILEWVVNSFVLPDRYR